MSFARSHSFSKRPRIEITTRFPLVMGLGLLIAGLSGCGASSSSSSSSSEESAFAERESPEPATLDPIDAERLVLDPGSTTGAATECRVVLALTNSELGPMATLQEDDKCASRRVRTYRLQRVSGPPNLATCIPFVYQGFLVPDRGAESSGRTAPLGPSSLRISDSRLFEKSCGEVPSSRVTATEGPMQGSTTLRSSDQVRLRARLTQLPAHFPALFGPVELEFLGGDLATEKREVALAAEVTLQTGEVTVTGRLRSALDDDDGTRAAILITKIEPADKAP